MCQNSYFMPIYRPRIYSSSIAKKLSRSNKFSLKDFLLQYQSVNECHNKKREAWQWNKNECLPLHPSFYLNIMALSHSLSPYIQRQFYRFCLSYFFSPSFSYIHPSHVMFICVLFLKGFDENSHLHRMNTSTTYISTKRKQQTTGLGKAVQRVEVCNQFVIYSQ